MTGPQPRIAVVPHIRRTTGSFRLLALVAVVGVVTGCIVAGIQSFVVFAQGMTLGFAAEQSVALPEHASLLRIGIALASGAVLATVVSRLIARFGTKPPIDAVEANALSGGTMTWYDGFAVVVPILVSVIFGASVGVDAALTQLGAVLASQTGRWLDLPRSDLRLMVGAGAAAAVAASYRAPIAGMLYAYELVLGTYSKRTLAPIGIAAISAVLTIWLLTDQANPFHLAIVKTISWSDYVVAVLIGGLATGTGIGVMLLVSAVERLLKRALPDETLRRLAAALLLLALSVRFPAVLGGGHAGIERAVNGHIAGPAAAALFGAKGLASAASLGAGFRGGLFSAALMIGALLGQGVGWLLPLIPAAPAIDPSLCAVIGMAAVGASIIGSPLAMIFLVLETTGDLGATIVVAIGAVTAAFLTDRLFGYSFATWQFQQRGLAIEGGHDVSRLHAADIKDIVRPPKRTIPVTADLGVVLRAISTAGARGTAVHAPDGAFVGLIDPRRVEAVEAEPGPLPVLAADLVYDTTPAVTPQTTLGELLDVFQMDDRSTMAVLDPEDRHKLIGCVRARDAYAAATAVLDAQRRDDLGVGR